METQSLMRVWHCKYVVGYRLSMNKDLVRVRWNTSETVLGHVNVKYMVEMDMKSYIYWRNETHFCSI